MFNRILDILDFDHSAFAAVTHMWPHLSQAEDLLAEVAFGKRVAAVNSFVLDLLLLVDSQAASFTDHAHKVAFIELMCSKDQLVVGQLVLAFYVVAFKSYLVQVLLFKFVYRLKCGVLWAFAWSGEELSAVRCLP